MTDLPLIAPSLAAAILAQVPERLQERARQLQPSSWTIVADTDGVRVAMAGATLTVTPTSVLCDCLLAPSCAHRAAMALHAVDDRVDAPGRPEMLSDTVDRQTEQAAAQVTRERTPADRLAAEQAVSALISVVREGVARLSPTGRAQLAAAVEMARGARLWRLEQGLTRVLDHVSQSGARDSGSTRVAVVAALEEAAQVALRLRRGSTEPGDIGRGRSEYVDVPASVLYGAACEPILSETGYGGVVTHWRDGDCRWWSSASVRPGVSADTVRGTYVQGVDLGRLSLTHREASRARVAVIGLRASGEGRLSTGRETRAAIVADPTGIAGPMSSDGPVQPTAEQVRRAMLDGRSLVDVPVEVVGPVPGGIGCVTSDGVDLVVTVTTAARRLGAVRGLAVLGARPGLALRVVGRPDTRRPGRLAGLAIDWAAADPGDGGSRQRWHPGLDPLSEDDVASPIEPSDPGGHRPWLGADEQVTAPSDVVENWLGRAAVHGAQAVSTLSAAAARDVARVERMGSPLLAARLAALVTALGHGSDDVLQRWVEAAIHTSATRLDLIAASWAPQAGDRHPA